MAATDGGPAFRVLTFAMPFLNALRLVRLPFVFSIVKVCLVQQLSAGCFCIATFQPFQLAIVPQHVNSKRLINLCDTRQNMFVESLGGDLGGKLLGLLPVWAVHLVDLLYAMFVLINLMGSLFLFTAYTEGLDRHTWLDDVGKAPSYLM